MLIYYHTSRCKHQQKQLGYSLIEISFVIVAIGLVVGAVIGGQSLLESAKLKALISEISNIEKDTITFETLYRQLPGDMSNASAYWPGTNNGNGDGQIQGNEIVYTWEHFRNANLLYNIVKDPTEIARSEFTDGRYSFRFVYSTFSKEGNTYEFGQKHPGGSSAPHGLLTPKQAYNTDTKIDDGHASLGKLFSIDGHSSTNASCTQRWTHSGFDNDSNPVPYNLANDAADCRLHLWLSPDDW